MKKNAQNNAKRNQPKPLIKKAAPLVLSTAMLASAFLMAGAPASALASEDLAHPKLYTKYSETMEIIYGNHGRVVSGYTKSIEGSPDKGAQVSTVAQGDVEAPAESDTEVEAPAESGTEVEAPAESGTEVEAPAESGTEVEAPAESGTDAEAPAESGTEVEAPAESDTEVEAPAESGTEVESPAESGTEVEAPAESGTEVESPAESGTDAESPAEEGMDVEAPTSNAGSDWATDTYQSLIDSYMTLVDYYQIYIGQYLFADVVEPEQETTVHDQMEMEADPTNTSRAESVINETQVDGPETQTGTVTATTASQVTAAAMSSDMEETDATSADQDSSVTNEVYQDLDSEDDTEGTAEATVISEEAPLNPAEDEKDQVSSNIESNEVNNEETVVDEEEISITETTAVDSDNENSSAIDSNQDESVSISLMDRFVGYYQQILVSYENFVSLLK